MADLPTDYYANNGIPYCKICGDSFHSDDDGKIFCPQSVEECEYNRTPKVEPAPTVKARAKAEPKPEA